MPEDFYRENLQRQQASLVTKGSSEKSLALCRFGHSSKSKSNGHPVTDMSTMFT